MRTLYIIVILCFTFSVQAQIKLPPKETETKAPVKQTTTVKTTETKPAYTGPVLVLKVTTDTDCNFYVDGDYRGFVVKDDVLKINLQKGDYQLKAVAANDPEKVVKQLYSVEITGVEKFHAIEFNKNAGTTTTSHTQNKIISEYGKDAEVTIIWLGPGSVKLYLDKEEFFFTEGQEKTLNLKSEHPYTLKAVKPDKTYNFSDYLGFEKGEQYYEVGISYNSLNAKKGISPAKKASNKIENDRSEYERLINEAKACPCQFVSADLFSNKKPREMVASCQRAINSFNNAKQYTNDNSKLQYLNDAIADREQTISSLKTEYYE